MQQLGDLFYLMFLQLEPILTVTREANFIIKHGEKIVVLNLWDIQNKWSCDVNDLLVIRDFAWTSSWSGAAFLCPVGRRWLSVWRVQACYHPVLPGGRHSGDQRGPRTQQWAGSLPCPDAQTEAAQESQTWVWWATLCLSLLALCIASLDRTQCFGQVSLCIHSRAVKNKNKQVVLDLDSDE